MKMRNGGVNMIKMPYDVELLNGRGEPHTFHIREADMNDFDTFLKLQDIIMDALPDKDIYAPFTDEETRDQLENDCCWLAFAENGDVAGVSVLVPNTKEDQSTNYGHHFNYDEEHLKRTASFDMTMVVPEYRGYGLQRLFNKIRIAKAIELGATEGITSISPLNPYSYNNFLILNFEIVDRRELYGGKDRYLLRKEF